MRPTDVGQVETREKTDVTKTSNGLQFILHSTSPIAIAWTDAVPNGEFSNSVNKETNGDDPANPGYPANPSDPNGGNSGNGTATSALKSSSGTAGTTESALASLLPKTGDTSKIIVWDYRGSCSSRGDCRDKDQI